MRPVLGIGRQHQARDLAQPADAGEQLAVEEAELAHGEDQQGEGCSRNGDRPSGGGDRSAGSAADGGRAWRRDRPATARGISGFSCRPIRRWRTCEVSVSITDTVMTISTRMRRHVGIVELADRLDQVLADAAGADEAHDRGAAHVDLEAQQRVAHEIRDGLRQRAEAHGDRPRRAAGGDALDRLHVDVLDHLGEQLAERARRYGWRRPARRPSGRARRRSRTPARTPAPARCGRTRRSGARTMRSQRLRRHVGRRKKHEHEGAERAQHGADIGHQQRLAEQPEPARQAPEPLGDVGPDRTAVLELGTGRMM